MKIKSTQAICDAWQLLLLSPQHNDPAVLDGKGQVLRTFADLEQQSLDFALLMNRVKPGEILVFVSPNHPDWVAVFLASLKTQAVLLPLEPGSSVDQNLRAAEQAGAHWFLHWNAKNQLECRALNPSQSKNIENPTKPGKVLCKMTSGTTGQPGRHFFDQAALAADLTQIVLSMGLRRRERNLAAIFMGHSYGFSNLVLPLLMHGMPIVLPSGRLPAELAVAACEGGASVFPAVPVLIRSLSESDACRNLGSLRLVISAGAPLLPDVAKQFVERSGVPIRVFYGSSECGGIAFDQGAQPVYDEGFVGHAMQGVRLESMNDGRIRVWSDAVADPCGYFEPPDLVKVMDNGCWLQGRVSDRIHKGARKIDPVEVERVLMLFDGVSEAVVFGIENEGREQTVIAAVVWKDEARSAALRQHCEQNLQAWKIPSDFWSLQQIPVLAGGKLSRRRLGDLYRDR